MTMCSFCTENAVLSMDIEQRFSTKLMSYARVPVCQYCAKEIKGRDLVIMQVKPQRG